MCSTRNRHQKTIRQGIGLQIARRVGTDGVKTSAVVDATQILSTYGKLNGERVKSRAKK